MTNWIRAPRWLALRLVALLVLAAAVASFAQSYRGLYLWAGHHGLTGLWAAIWPLQVDTFIAVGELALFVALVDRWHRRQRAVAWAVTAAGLVVSVAGNVGHAPTHDVFARFTYAAPPVAAAAALFVGLVILKSVVNTRHFAQPVTAAVAREVATVRAGEHAYAAELAASQRPVAKPRTPAERPHKAATRRPPRRSQGGQREAAMAALVAEPGLTPADITERFHVPPRTARRYVKAAATAVTANGNDPAHTEEGIAALTPAH